MDERPAVFITGASTGIGKGCAIYLMNKGFRVFAGFRKDRDGEALREASLTPVQIDVNDVSSIETAVATVKEKTDGKLFGLVNNAGVALAGPLEMNPKEEIKRVIDTNVTGLLLVTKVCMPLLREARGRIVNVSSVGGRVALPGSSVYGGSKFAVNAITEALRIELKNFGIFACVVEPGAVETAIWGKLSSQTHDTSPEVAQKYAIFTRFFERFLESVKGVAPDVVAEQVHHALTSKRPKRRYLIGKDARQIAMFARFPGRIREWLISRQFGL